MAIPRRFKFAEFASGTPDHAPDIGCANPIGFRKPQILTYGLTAERVPKA